MSTTPEILKRLCDGPIVVVVACRKSEFRHAGILRTLIKLDGKRRRQHEGVRLHADGPNRRGVVRDGVSSTWAKG